MSSLLRHTKPFRTLSTLPSSYQSVAPANRQRTCRHRIHKLHKTCSFIDINKTSNQFCRFYANDASNNTHDDICHLLHEIGSRVESANTDRRARRTSVRSSERKSASFITSKFCKVYLSRPDNQLQLLSDNNNDKCEIIKLLISERYDIEKDTIISTIDNVRSKSILGCNDIQKIREICTPQYESIFQYILDQAQNDLGVAFLVRLRRDVRDLIHYMKFVDKEVYEEIQQQSKLKRLQTLERSIHALLTSLFRPGVLKLKRITFEETPAAIIEQIALREAVHPLQSLQELKSRLGPGRRCFAFFHPALPSKPLVFVHVALLREIPQSMNDIVSDDDDSERNATCATFYSITNTEPGLTGVDLGNHLIKSVVQVLKDEFPALDTFSTISPLPKFRSWLEDKLTRYHEQIHNTQNSEESEMPNLFIDKDLLTEKEMQKLEEVFSTKTPLLDLIQTLKSPTWYKDSHLGEQLQPLLMKLAAYYLTKETYRGRPLCPVAKFHIRNGAEMYRLNYTADTSSKGLRNSCGIMINYHYALDHIEENRIQYEVNGDIVVKDGVKCWLNE